MRLSLLPLLVVASVLAAEGPSIALDRAAHAFGRISTKEKVRTQFQVSNRGDAPLHLGSVETSCECASAGLGKTTLAPGESTTLEILLDPQKAKGPLRRTVAIHSDDPQRPTALLSVGAEVVPPVVLSQDELFFPDLFRGDAPTREVRCSASSGEALGLLEVQVPPKAYLRVETRTEGGEVVLKVALNASRLPADASRGIETVVLRTSHPDAPQLPLTIYWGRGRAIEPSPAQLNFDPSKPAQEQPLPLSLNQARKRPFRILGCTSTDPCFRAEGISKAAASEQALVVRLDPGSSSGGHTGQLRFTTDDPDQPEVVVEVMAFVPERPASKKP